MSQGRITLMIIAMSQPLTLMIKNRVVTASDSQAGVVGPTLLLDLQIEGVRVEALVDTGSQCTIISRTTLHAIAKHLRENGHPLPKLEEQTVKLFGKDGQNGSPLLGFSFLRANG